MKCSLFPAVVGLGLSLALVPACSMSNSSPKGTITLYSGQHQQTTDMLIAGFEKATGVKVAVRYNDENTFVDQILTEGSNSPADVILTENTPALVDLQEHGDLAALPADVLSRTPSQYNSEKGRWVGVSARVSVIVYNPSKISAADLPTHITDLADPRYKGKFAFAPSESDFQPIVTAFYDEYGEARTVQWLKGLKSNASEHTYGDNEAVVSKVNQGSAAFSVINQYYWYRFKAEQSQSDIHSALAYFAPKDPGYVVDVSGVGVLASSKHQVDAARFAAYLVSAAGQEIIAHSQSYEYPLVSGVAAGAEETPLAQLQPVPLSLAQLGDGSKAVSLEQKAGAL